MKSLSKGLAVFVCFILGSLVWGFAGFGVAATWRVLEGEMELRVRCVPLPPQHPCVMDGTGDGRVGAADFNLLAMSYGNTCNYEE